MSSARVLPSALDVAAFQDNIHVSWLLQHYQHRPVLHNVISLSAHDNLGQAAKAAVKVMSATLFAQFFDTTVSPKLDSEQTPYNKAYGYAIRALYTQISFMDVDSPQSVLVPVLLLFITDV